jgi:hypothetical protein
VPRRRWRWRNLLLQRRQSCLLRPPLRLLALGRRCWSFALPLRLRRLLAFGAGSPTKEPSPRWSLWALDPSAWLLRAGAAPCASSSLRDGAAPTFSLCRCSGTGTFSFPLPAGAGPPWLDPPGPWSVRCWRSGEVPEIRIPRLGSPPTSRTPDHPRRGSALTPRPTTAMPGPRTGP